MLGVLNLPSRDGREQIGRRPCLVLSETKTDLVIIAPLTSNLQALRFPNTLKIKISETNNLAKDSAILMFQLQALDKRRFISKIGEIENSYLKEVDKILKMLFNL